MNSYLHNRNRIGLSIGMVQTIFFVLLSTFLLLCPSIRAQQLPPEPEIKFTSSLNPVGSGARALSMGGAFIAFADDATAASWNPAGLKNLLRPEISAVVNYNGRREGFTFNRSNEASNIYRITNEDINYLSVANPFMWLNRNFVVSLNYQYLYNFDRKMHFQWIYTKEDESDWPEKLKKYTANVNYNQTGNLKAFSPAMVVFVTPQLFVGMTLNFWSDKFSDNGWVENYYKSGTWFTDANRVQKTYTESHDRYSFSGFNMNFGLLWDINRYFTLGAVVKTPFTAHLRHEEKSLTHYIRYIDNEWKYINPEESFDLPTTSHDRQKLRMPLAYGIGLAARPSDRLIIDLDIYRMEWNNYELIDASGAKLSPITGLFKEESSIKPTHHIRLGGEYVFLLKKITLSLRMGTFYDPEPAKKSPDDFYGFALGTGITMGPFAIDFAYQYRFGKNVEGDSIKGETTPAEVKQHLIYNSIIYYF